jgi:acetyltransferase-like isoleucine patch superfamily enzyme
LENSIETANFVEKPHQSAGANSLLRKMLKLRPEMSWGFYICDFIFRKLLRQNSGVTWAIHHTTVIHCPEKIKRGTYTFPGDSPGMYINAINGIEIGDYTNIAPNVGLISANHDVVDNNLHVQAPPIKLGKFCWLGMGCIVLPRVVLGDFTVVGAGAIVTKSFEEGYCVIAGNPARMIKKLNKEACDAYAKTKV